MANAKWITEGSPKQINNYKLVIIYLSTEDHALKKERTARTVREVPQLNRFQVTLVTQ
jgi:hypothetical protein